MAATWPYLLGRNLTVAVTPQNISALGVLTDNSTVGTLTFEGLLESANGGALRLQTSNISAMDDFHSNPVPFEKSVRYSISEFASARGDDGNLLFVAYLASFYWKVNFSLWDNDVASTEPFLSETAYVLCTEFNPDYRKDRCVAQANVELISIWDTNPSFS